MLPAITALHWFLNENHKQKYKTTLINPSTWYTPTHYNDYPRRSWTHLHWIQLAISPSSLVLFISNRPSQVPIRNLRRDSHRSEIPSASYCLCRTYSVDRFATIFQVPSHADCPQQKRPATLVVPAKIATKSSLDPIPALLRHWADRP